ncbi:MAG TPA: NfeD family protein [Thermoanaerobaculia bacterium]|nr:NfeD family protein [Thermoanaerobaculia bacterium]
MEWWIWILVGFLLLGLELLSTTLHLAFFGIGALLVGLAIALGLDVPLWAELLLFTAASVGLLLFRQPVLRLFRTGQEDRRIDDMVGETAVVRDEIAVNALGRAELRGTLWTARNMADRPLVPGERCTVVKIEGLTLFITSS